MKRKCAESLVIFILLCVSAYAGATQGDTKQALPAGQAQSQPELDEYNRIHKESDPATKKRLINHFAATYGDSELLALVYQEGAYLGRQSNDIAMMADYGEKSLKLRPDNCILVTDLASVYVQRDRVDEAEAAAGRALDLLNGTNKPASEAESAWVATKRGLAAINHSTLGYVHLRRAQSGLSQGVRKSEANSALLLFRKALEERPIDDYTFYGLGFAFAILNDYENAESNLAKAVAVEGVVMASARSMLEDIYRSRHNQSLEGIGSVVAKARVELGLQ